MFFLADSSGLTVLVYMPAVVRCDWSVFLGLGFEAQLMLKLERQVTFLPLKTDFRHQLRLHC